ncbi:hypothetical protein GT624_23715 [Enterobacter hormaechei]|uniref:ADP-ribosyltransferase-containing protein n=1 Tax=Bacteroides xylanisolvens TaxID=371601 RepID=UPI00136CD0EC|nr:DUF3990 domain-containing protein [Bacteroides xylanisolvens]MZJ75712.1 hypothetical protein [Enterobacter hormaechei]MZK16422.1 hypothetical protein [Enterobacter hormaechei]MZR85851.1 hypothetical protein [Bifidobacterium longum]
MDIEDTLYHGSKNDFNEFEIPKYHTNGGTLGYGIYLTDSIERAKSYANDSGYLYTVELNDELTNSKPLSAKEVTLTVNQVAQIIEKVAQKQIDEEEYPYILSDWEEPTSETTMDAGNKAIVKRIAQNIVDDTDDLNIINGISNQLGGNDNGAQMLNPVLKEMNIHYAVLDVDYYDKSKEYVVFNPEDIKISNKQDIRLLNEQNKNNEITENLGEIAKEKLVVKADNPVEAVKKLYNGNLQYAIQDSYTLSDISEKEADYFRKTATWEDVADIEKSNNAIKDLGHGYYADEYIERNDNNPHSANQSILKNNDPEHPTLSQQYKNLLKQVQDPAKNNQQAEKQLKQVHQEISNRTQNQLKDFAKHNPEVKQPEKEETQQIRR